MIKLAIGRGSIGIPHTSAGTGVSIEWTRSRAAQALFWSAACLAVLFLREPNAVLHPQLWAEDGPVFFLGARRGFAVWFETYNGYYHLLPRIIAAIGTLFDPAYIPQVYVYGAMAVTGLVASRVFSRRIDWPHRPLIALAIVLVPHSGEVFFNPTNIQWVAALALILTLLMSDPESVGDWIADVATIVLAGLSGPFSVFAAPVFLWRAFRRRSLASWLQAGLVVGVASLQAWQLYREAGARSPHGETAPFLAVQAVQVFCARVPLALFGARVWISSISPATAMVAGLCIVAGVTWIAATRDRRTEARTMLVAFLGLLLAVTFWKVRPDTWSYTATDLADRYFYLPKVVLLWLLIGSTDLDTLRGRIACATTACIVTASLLVFRLAPKPPDRWVEYVPALRVGQSVTVVVNPGFGFVVPAKPWASLAVRRQ